MNHPGILLALAGTFFLAAGNAAQAAGDPSSTALHALFHSEWERSLRESPETATYFGDNRYADRWTDLSPEAIAARRAATREALARLHAIDPALLDNADRLDYRVFEWQLERSIERERFHEEFQPIDQRRGVQIADGLAEIARFRTPADYRAWIARLRALPRHIDQTIALLREGIRTGRVPPRVLVERVVGQVDRQVVEDPLQSPFYRAFAAIPPSFPAADREALQSQARDAVRESVVPAFRRLGAFLREEYLPKSRSSIAVSDLPDGRAYYDFLVRDFTTTTMNADEIHELGLREVARLHAALEKARADTGFQGTLAQFFADLRSNPRFYCKTPEALLERYRATAKRIDPELVKVFRTIPRQPYGVRPIPDNAAPDSTAAYYQPGAVDGTRAGYYYVNLYRPEMRPTWEMMPLSLHEAVPGHHFQFARSLELPAAPEFRRTAYFIAYSEGWGLYAEQLGYDMGLYDDPYDRVGQLAYEMWRAIRLVVDTGMHTRGWSREKAIAYFRDNAPKTEQDIVNEIDRYIGDPGQALGYKIGQLRISALRERASRELGDRFDLRDFNDAVLATGSVPLAVLEEHIGAWIEAKKLERQNSGQGK